MIAPARRAAFDALVALESGTDLPSVLAAARHSLTEPRDHALLTELVTGTVRQRLAIDYQLSHRLSRPIERLDAAVLATLRLGAFQLLHLHRVPISAVVDDAVSLTKRAGKTSASGLVNAVLRSLAREQNALTWPEGNSAEALSIRFSHPEWLVARWLARYGEEATIAWLTFNNQSPRLCLAANGRRTTRDALRARLEAGGVRTEPTARAPRGLVVTDGYPLATPSFREGCFVVQDEASQLVVDLGKVRRGGRVLDLCASPGGKTVGLAERVSPEGMVVACDVRPRRVRLLRATVSRCGVEAVRVVQVPDTGHLPFREEAFDLVLVDAPCSGLGTIRRDADIRWRRAEDDLTRLAAAQLVLLMRASAAVADGGTLVYATCSSEPEENDEVAEAFLADHPAFTLVHEHRTLPFRDALEAFYAAVMVRDV
jgi:16S rRNA (cytosine967-C5)-methyltransferase